MSKRDLETELEWYEIDESGDLNALYLFILLLHFKKCTLNQLAIAFYLFRFVNILNKLLSPKDSELFIKDIPKWEISNLDSILAPYIIEKFDNRFLSGFREILTKKVVLIDGESIILNEKIKDQQLILNHQRLFHKAKYACKIVKKYDSEKLLNRITKIVGEEKWKTHYTFIE